MNEELNNTELQQLAQNDLLNEWLGECGFTARNMSEIDAALALLAAKRTTLEEKIIRKELHILVSNYCAILSYVHKALSVENELPPPALEGLRLLNLGVHTAVSDLLKALRYNLNYVEQYFEFDFCNRLLEKYKFNDEAQEVLKLVSGETP